MRNTRTVALAFAVLLSPGLLAGAASAMPADRLPGLVRDTASMEQVRWVCGYYGCRWRPDYYYRRAPYPYWGPPVGNNCYYNGCCPPGMTIQGGVCKPYRGY